MSVRKSLEIYVDDSTPGEDSSELCLSVNSDGDIYLLMGNEDTEVVVDLELDRQDAEAIRDFLNEVLG